jgi:hypothetical protein
MTPISNDKRELLIAAKERGEKEETIDFLQNQKKYVILNE